MFSDLICIDLIFVNTDESDDELAGAAPAPKMAAAKQTKPDEVE